ncbi:helix-turn-helix transcriptional regulator [Humibacter antri]
MLLRHAVGSAIRRLRLAKGMTLRQMSQASAISLPYLSEIERGRKEPSSEIIQTVCVVLGITLRQLMRETDVELRGGAWSEGPVGLRRDPSAESAVLTREATTGEPIDLTARRREAGSSTGAPGSVRMPHADSPHTMRSKGERLQVA